jgi:predicted xylose isomerase-like sugar epimerase
MSINDTTQIFIAMERLRGLIEPLGWTIVAQDMRSDNVAVTLSRAKSSMVTVPAEPPQLVPPPGGF